MQVGEDGAESLAAVALDKAAVGALGRVAGGDLGAHVAGQLVRHPRVRVHQPEEGLVGPARLVHFQNRDAQPFLEDLRGVNRRAARRDAAHVNLVHQGRGITFQFAAVEQRLDDIDVRQMHPAGGIGIVEDEDVAGVRVVAIPGDERLHAVREGAEMQRHGQAVGDRLAVPVAQAGRIVHRIAHDRGIGRAHDDQRHLVGDRRQGVAHHLQGDRIGVAARAAHSAPSFSSTIFCAASRRAVQPGGTTQVASYSSTISGPPRSAAVRASRGTTGTFGRPAAAPKKAGRAPPAFAPPGFGFGAGLSTATVATARRVTLSTATASARWP